MSEVKTGRYNVACTRYFEAVHKLPAEYQAQAFSHPNQYFEESQRLLNGDNKGETNPIFDISSFMVNLSCGQKGTLITSTMNCLPIEKNC